MSSAHVQTAASLRSQRRQQQDHLRALKKQRQMNGEPARLIVVRHGETTWNAEGRLQGQTDAETALNELGAAQAAAVRPMKELRERKLGLLEGLRRAEAGQQQPAAWECLLSPVTSTSLPGGGESLDELRARVTKALEQIAACHPGETVVVVTHGGPLNAMYSRAMEQPAKFKMVNCAVNEIHISGSAWAGTVWNNVEHLQSVGFMCTAAGGGKAGG